MVPKKTESSSETSRPAGSSCTAKNKLRVPVESKMAILALIKEKRNQLFGQFSTEIENTTKVAAWNEVKLKAQSLGACTPDRDWKWVRDSLYGVWKTRSMAKRDNSRKTGAPGGKKRLPDSTDELIYDIIGKDSPVIEGLPVNESGAGPSVRTPDPDMDQELVLSDDDESAQPAQSQKSKNRVEYSKILKEKRELQISLLKMENYKAQLQILKMEKDLSVPHSEFTKKLAETCRTPIEVIFHSSDK